MRVSSGNSAALTFKQTGQRVVIDVNWERAPTQADINELDALVAKSLSPTLQVEGSVYAETESDVNRITKAFLAGGLS